MKKYYQHIKSNPTKKQRAKRIEHEQPLRLFKQKFAKFRAYVIQQTGHWNINAVKDSKKREEIRKSAKLYAKIQ